MNTPNEELNVEDLLSSIDAIQDSDHMEELSTDSSNSADSDINTDDTIIVSTFAANEASADENDLPEDVPSEDATAETETSAISSSEMNDAHDVSAKKKKRRKSPVGLFILLGFIAVFAVILFVLYHNVNPYYCSELGSTLPETSVFMKSGTASYIDPPQISMHEEGIYILNLSTSSGNRKVVLQVKDTVAPVGEDANVSVSMDHRISAEEAVKNVSDASAYLVRWKSEPKQGVPGIYYCEVEIIDAYENKGYVPVTVTVLAVKEVLEWEIGSILPTANDFLAVNRNSAVFEGGIPDISTDHLGETEVYITLDGVTYKSVLRIVDTVAPEFNCSSNIVATNSTPVASSLVDYYRDMTDVQFSFKEQPDTSKNGTVTTTIVATDAAGNQSFCDVELVVCDEVLELATVNYPQTAGMILEKLGYTAEAQLGDEVILEASYCGTKFVELHSTKGIISVALRVTDTDAPTATAVRVDGFTNYTHTVEEFVTNVQDGSPVTMSFVTEPNWSLAGQQVVSVSLKDAIGNESIVSATLNLVNDTTPPVIYAAIDRYCYVNEAVSYLKEVFAEDNADPDVVITVDKSQVDAKSKGTYPVTYTATDRSGNETSVTVQYTFIEQTVTDEELEALVDRIFAKILTDDMSVAEQAYAIYEYVYDRIWYTGQSDKTNWKYEAYNGMTQGVGDCYTFYAAEYLLLTHIDCQVLSVERMNGKTQHFWCLVNLGTGWYHFDACNVGPEKIHAFMKTTEELVPLSEQYWRFDKTLYPEVETTPFEMF